MLKEQLDEEDWQEQVGLSQPNGRLAVWVIQWASSLFFVRFAVALP